MRTRLARPASALLLSLVLTVPAFAGGPGGGTNIQAPTIEQLAPDIDLYRQHLMTLSNPFFEGRAPGTEGNRHAANYIEWHLKRLGLSPAFPTVTTINGVETTVERSSWRQPFEAPVSTRPGDSFKVRDQTVVAAGAELKPGTDFNVIGYSANAEVTNAPLAFAGYSLEEGQGDYTSYPKGSTLKGKAAIVLRFEPMDENGKSKWAEERWSQYAGLEPKMLAAQDAGAAAIILVNPPGAADDRINRLEDLGLVGRRKMKVPVIHMSIGAADALVKAADESGRGLLDLRKIADEAGGIIDLPKATVSMNVKVEQVPLMTDNVGGVLAGKGNLADQWIVIGSHYDHVGYGYVGARPENRGLLHPGADDNGSGTSGNLLCAERLAKAYAELPAGANARSILFLWFSAEESGLVGSRWFVNHPTVPLDKISIMFNMDMIGRLREGKCEVGGIGTAPGLAEWCKPYWESSGLTIKPTRIGASNSDHYSFHTKKVPNLFFFTGLHKEYHTPADTGFTVNFEGGAVVADLCARMALDAAQYEPGFKFGIQSDKDDQDAEENPHAAAQQNVGTVSGVGVRFGIMPGDYSGEDGVMIGDAEAGLPAAKAGLKGGDKMISWNGEKLTTVESWMPLLSKGKPGDKVKIVFIRDGKEMTTEAELVARGRPRQ